MIDAVATVTDDGELAVVYQGAGPGLVRLSLLKPDSAGTALDTTVDLGVVPMQLGGASGVLVAVDVAVPDGRGVRGLSASNGEHLWSYAHDFHGNQDYMYQLLKVNQERVVIQARLQGPGSELVDSHLIALDPGTGQLRWSRPQVAEPVDASLNPHYRNVSVFGDVLVAHEPEPEQARLAGYDVETGEELWRVVDPVTTPEGGPDRGAYLADAGPRGAALLPGAAGVVEVDLATGGMRTILEGVRVVEVVADDRTVMVDFLSDGVRMIALYDRR